ncbi:MAG: tetratricopeptide repeat protein [Roseibacillus sp.]
MGSNPSLEYAYRKAWRALNTMLEEGRSYSGFERNSAFLNLGGPDPAYAEISGACGLDVMDDGRSIAVCDWDFDGRQDFWITNRTAPRLRFQHNRSQTKNSFLALKLRGTTCNRSAIGARIELRLKGQAANFVRTPRAGEGFLAQSSSWMQFGLPAGSEISSLTVRWPGGETESISGVAPGKFFTVTEGTGKALPWTPPTPAKALADLPAGAKAKPGSQAARIVMASPLPLPVASYLNLEGTRIGIDPAGKPLLLNLWATWCAPCVAEMDAWKEEASTLRKLGIGILALSVDDPALAFAERAKIVKPFLDKRKFPFAAGLADERFLDVLEVAGRAQLDKYETLPVPSSLLLDKNGRIAVIYKGMVNVKQLAADVALLEADRASRHREAAHFPGRWIEGPWPATPTQMIDKFMSFGQPEAARRYLDRFLQRVGEAANQDLSESYFLVGGELALQKNFAEALTAFGQAVKLNPSKTRARLGLATLLFRMSRFGDSVPHLRTIVTEQPMDHNTRKMLSLALSQSGDYTNAARHMKYLVSLDSKDAIAKLWYGHVLIRLERAAEAEQLFRAALGLQPNSLLVLNELAWLLATHTDPKIYRPEEALKLATQAAGLSKHREPRVLDTLAAAQAANGDFETAVKTVARAITLAEAAKDKKTTKQLQGRRAGYLAKRPHRESLPASD